MRRFIKYLLFLLIIAVIGIQFIEDERTNPPVTGDLIAPSEVKNIFRKSCYDCHSNETSWPWYSKIAPMSWLIEKDVNEGRKHLNFSEWETYNDSHKAENKSEIWEEVNSEEMPLKNYTYLHPNSVLDYSKKSIIKEWATKKKAWE